MEEVFSQIIATTTNLEVSVEDGASPVFASFIFLVCIIIIFIFIIGSRKISKILKEKLEDKE